jgi:hypothetical protein
MALDHIERVMGRRQINALIEADPVLVVFFRASRIDTGDGSYRLGTPAPVLVNGKAQEVALIPFKRRMTEFLVNTELGNVPDLPYVLLGRHDLDVEEKDTFEWNGDKFEVQTIDLKTEVRVAAHVDYYGGNPNG